MPGPDIAAMMAAMQAGQGQPPGSPGMPMTGPPQAPPPPTDEDVLAQVQGAMGAAPGTEGGPPPGSGMKWENLQDDQAALQADPSPENVQAFVQYWGEENLPQGLAADEPESRGPPEAAEGEY
jgi:hypothetical protein